MEKYQVRAHPAYYMGFGRASCQFCIFGNADQFATAAAASPERFEELAAMEENFGVTMKRKGTLRDLVEKGEVYEASNQETAGIATSEEYNQSIIMDNWTLPAGAYGESCGPV